jgi:hypothetical protein
MTERKIFDCDDCDRKGLTEIAHIDVQTDTFTDAAGSRDTREEYADLCPNCLRKHLMRFLDNLSDDEGKKWIRGLNTHR